MKIFKYLRKITHFVSKNCIGGKLYATFFITSSLDYNSIGYTSLDGIYSIYTGFLEKNGS